MPPIKPEISSIDCSHIFAGELSREVFLREYWQKKPVLFRQAFPGFTSPLSPEELAGLACEDGINARLIIEKDTARPWSVQYGPFDDEDFAQLPADHWTLLVSDVEKHVEEARAIRDCFRFIPDWRIDDLMFSYAPEGGSVGPHTDAYDVFLLQAYGRRNWMISENYDNQLLPNCDLSILSNFSAEQQWILEPGDMLYLPPNVAHHGVAVEPCITCSIGFRAPSVRAMVSEYAEYIANRISKDARYADPNLQNQQHPSEITPAALSGIKHLLKSGMAIDDDMIERWFGEFMTDARSGTSMHAPEQILHDFRQLEKLLQQHEQIYHSPMSRFLFSRSNHRACLFVDGHSYDCSLAFAEAVTQYHQMPASLLLPSCTSSEDQNTLVELYNRGCLYFPDATN